MDDGYAVGLDARVQFGTPTTPTPAAESPATQTATATPRPSGFVEYTVYYLVTERFAVRGGRVDGDPERGEPPAFPDPETVACRDNG